MRAAQVARAFAAGKPIMLVHETDERFGRPGTPRKHAQDKMLQPRSRAAHPAIHLCHTTYTTLSAQSPHPRSDLWRTNERSFRCPRWPAPPWLRRARAQCPSLCAPVQRWQAGFRQHGCMVAHPIMTPYKMMAQLSHAVQHTCRASRTVVADFSSERTTAPIVDETTGEMILTAEQINWLFNELVSIPYRRERHERPTMLHEIIISIHNAYVGGESKAQRPPVHLRRVIQRKLRLQLESKAGRQSL